MSITPASEEALAQKDIAYIEQLEQLDSRGSTIRCSWDVGAGTQGAGGQNGKYRRQCKMQALNGAQLCRIHAQKALLFQARFHKTRADALADRPIRRTALTKGVIDKDSLRVSISDLQEADRLKTDVTRCVVNGGLDYLGTVCHLTK